MNPSRTDSWIGSAEDQAIGWWRAVVERSTDIIMAFGADGLVSYASPALTRLLGWDASDLVGTDGLHIVEPSDRDRVARVLRAVVNHERASRQVFQASHRDGSIRQLEARGTDHLDDPEVAAVLISLRDVTDRVDVEIALAARDELYRHLVEATPDAILVHRDGRILAANRAAANLVGYAATSELTGRLMSDLFGPDTTGANELWSPARQHRVTRLDGIGIDAELTAIPTMWDSRPAVQVVIRDVTERQIQGLELLHQATHDPLTGLPNRSLLADRLEHASSRAERTRRSFAVLFVDLDRFKVVNDTLGHEVGDELLRQIAGRLVDAVRPGDTVARLGGDEFVVVVEDLLVNDTVDLVVERIQAGFATPFSYNDRDFLVNASIGVLVTAEGGDPKSLIRDADAAMYTAKTQGRGRAVRFDAALRERASRHEEISLRLRAAIEEGQLWAAFQPVVRLADRHTTAVEALLRWEHPQRGPMLPDAFLDVADDAGILPSLGEWMIEATCHQLVRWRIDRSDRLRTFWAAVNVGHSEMLNPSFARTILDALARHGLPGSALCLDVTERALLDDPGQAAEVLRPLRDAGVMLAIDDFGTGYTSLAALRRFSPDHVKIDRAFVAGMADSPSDAALVRAVIQMGHALGSSVIAEGVELAEQQHLLAVLGCDLAQGFLLGRPVRAEELVLTH